LPSNRGFEQRDLVGREVEEAIDDLIDLALDRLDFAVELI
jgi:hypothetical protein